jgi:uridine kinase
VGSAVAILLAGPSGSGKSRVARLASCPQLPLDDFYLDLDHPGLPRTPSTGSGQRPSTGSGRRLGIVDWDDVASWDTAQAMAAIVTLCTIGEATVPTYDISTSRRVGRRTLDLEGARCFVAEGLFAPHLVTACREAGVLGDALYLDRPRLLTMLLRFVRDVREHRKPIGVLIRRGLALYRAEPAVRTRALGSGCRPVSLQEALRVVKQTMQTMSS